MTAYGRYPVLALASLAALLFSLSLSYGILTPPSSGTSVGGLLSSLSTASYSGTSLFGIPWSVVMSIILSAIVAFIVYGALKGTHMANGAGAIGTLFGAILLVILYLNPNYLILLTSIAFVFAFIIFIMGTLAFARKKLSAPAKVLGIVLAVILLYTLFASNPSVGNYIDNVVGFNISGLMLPILSYMFALIIIYIVYILTYRRAKLFLSKFFSALVIIIVAAALLIPGFLHFIVLSAELIGAVLLALLLLALFLKLWHGRERVERIPTRPSSQYPGVGRPALKNKTFVIPATSRKTGKSFFRLGSPGGKGGGFATKREIEEYKSKNPPPSLYLDISKKKKKK